MSRAKNSAYLRILSDSRIRPYQGPAQRCIQKMICLSSCGFAVATLIVARPYNEASDARKLATSHRLAGSGPAHVRRNPRLHCSRAAPPRFRPPGGAQSAAGPPVLDYRESGALHPAAAWNGTFGRRAFLRGTAACPALLTTLSPVAALVIFSPATAEDWQDKTFWDDGTGWSR